jgi:hypothetical protein
MDIFVIYACGGLMIGALLTLLQHTLFSFLMFQSLLSPALRSDTPCALPFPHRFLMGIQNLLAGVLTRFIRTIVKVEVVVAEKGQTCCIDFNGWMHKAMQRVPQELFEGMRDTARMRVVGFFRSALKSLRSSGMESVHFVLDGAPLPSKAGTNRKREAERDAAARKATLLHTKANEGVGLGAAEKKEYAKFCIAACRREQWLESAVLASFLNSLTPRMTCLQ